MPADDRGRVVFSDDFNRNESQETKDEVGNGWSTNSASRAKGNKQVDLKDGAMHIVMHKEADHAVSVKHDGEFKNGGVELRFKLDDPKDTLGLDFADLELKTVHAGHLFKVTVGDGKLVIADLKTGNMDLKIYEARQAKQTLTDEQKKQLAGKQKSFPLKLNPGEWYTLGVSVEGDTVRTTINGKPVGEFSSEGFAHPTKRALRLAVPKEAWVDDVKMFAKEG
ncbi:hypothetical protein AYO47_07215 [Planctomyces sp. SCGC AG-212-M04]|nr:hypothetical protein AYO47_07215 [Planctomyces sp. SCGC AG-212-M04]